ncbi:MAG: hypothetical protein ACI8P9_000453 [Parasphingorhabdus sp.]|jgi:antitoxin component of RelBE/YafQ-DinJ toxin-antitoxin module
MQKGLPFEAKIPNAETITTFDEAKDPKKPDHLPRLKNRNERYVGKRLILLYASTLINNPV